MSPVMLVLALLGTTLSIAGLAVDIVDYTRPKRWTELLHRRALQLGLARLVHRDARLEAMGNTLPLLRQVLLILGAMVLAVVAGLGESAVYLGLELLLVVSGALWFASASASSARMQLAISSVRVFVTLAVLLALFALDVVAGIHWVGVVALELLGIGFVLVHRLWRPLFVLAGPMLLCVYAILGIVFEPRQIALHTVWLVLNVLFAGFAAAVFIKRPPEARS